MTRTIGLSVVLLAAVSGCKSEPNAAARAGAVPTANTQANAPTRANLAGSAVVNAMRESPAGGPATAVGQGVLRVGGIATGELDTTDTPLLAGAVGDDYALTLTGGETVTILTRGGPSSTPPGSLLDVTTVLIHNGEEVARDDDSAGNHNSRIVHNVTETGPYVIRVSSSGTGLKRGTYTLQVYAGALPGQT